MSDFKWRHYQGGIILGCVRWYCEYGISYRESEEMMQERGLEADHTTIYRWIQYSRSRNREALAVALETNTRPKLAGRRNLCEGQGGNRHTYIVL